MLRSKGRSSPSRSARVPAALLICAAAAAKGIGPVLQSGDQHLELVDGLVESFWCLTVVASTVFRLCDHLADRLVPLGQRCGEMTRSGRGCR